MPSLATVVSKQNSSEFFVAGQNEDGKGVIYFYSSEFDSW